MAVLMQIMRIIITQGEIFFTIGKSKAYNRAESVSMRRLIKNKLKS